MSIRITKASRFSNKNETKKGIQNESAATASIWRPAPVVGVGSNNITAKQAAYGATTVGVAGLVYYLYNQLPSAPSVPGYTQTVGGAFQDAAFVPDAPLSEVQNAQRAVHAEMYPGRVNIAANPQVTGVDFGQSRGEFRGFDPSYTPPNLSMSADNYFDFGAESSSFTDASSWLTDTVDYSLVSMQGVPSLF